MSNIFVGTIEIVGAKPIMAVSSSDIYVVRLYVCRRLSRCARVVVCVDTSYYVVFEKFGEAREKN